MTNLKGSPADPPKPLYGAAHHSRLWTRRRHMLGTTYERITERSPQGVYEYAFLWWESDIHTKRLSQTAINKLPKEDFEADFGRWRLMIEKGSVVGNILGNQDVYDCTGPEWLFNNGFHVCLGLEVIEWGHCAECNDLRSRDDYLCWSCRGKL